METSILEQIPDEYREIYKKSWKTIKPSVKKGRFKDVYHFPLFTSTNNEITSKAQEIVANYNENFKVNVAFGFILRDRSTDDLKFFHPSNNTMMFETPRLMQTESDYRQLIDDIDRQDAFEYARSNRPSTKWIVKQIICVRFDVYRFDLRS